MNKYEYIYLKSAYLEYNEIENIVDKYFEVLGDNGKGYLDIVMDKDILNQMDSILTVLLEKRDRLKPLARKYEKIILDA